MDLYGFLFILVSIILGLGISELLGGVGRILRGDLVPGSLHTLWILIVFQLNVQMAWGLWGLHQKSTWRYSEFILLLLGPMCLYMAAAVLFPRAMMEDDLDQHLMKRRRPFFLLNAGYVVVTSLYAWFLFNEGWLPGQAALRLLVIGMLLALAMTEKRWVHWTVGLIILASHLWWTYLFTFVMAAAPSGR